MLRLSIHWLNCWAPNRHGSGGLPKDEVFKKIKQFSTAPAILTLYGTSAATKIPADASSYGVRAVLLQLSDQKWKPVAYASWKLSATKKCYARIKKEALALTWA